VAAPSKLQRPAGDRVKTDARDARHLARLLHLGQIAEVTIPSIEQEAARDLVRAREDCRGDLMTARHRVSKLLLRQGIVYYGGKAWTAKHEQWLRSHRFTAPGLQLAYDAAFDAMLATLDRRDRLDRAISAIAADSAFTPVVTRLSCVRGISTVTAFGLAVEIGDWGRLSGRAIGNYLGLVGVMMLYFRKRLRHNTTLLIRDEQGQQWSCGTGEPATPLRADGYELLRASYSRRSQRRIAAWNWTPAPSEQMIERFGSSVHANTTSPSPSPESFAMMHGRTTVAR